ncbi:sulfatase-like hydrolase/transferase [Roseibium litorale]|uniref:Sulfatase-like hydrolase/transferase n=1 Tax=Roseibium litorale TaxID=2803841 RepID=A0ABR9CS43_9HYPH|nr:sulfatase-like hydrolase/transferase [Roseibium litorale]
MTQTGNLLIIMSDEHTSAALGVVQSDVTVHTPNLDALARRGVRFAHAYTPCPICVPARASFASGQYVHKNRLWDNAMPYTGSPRGWGHALQDIGVRVESIGKLHYRSDEDPAGFDVEHIPMHIAGGHGMVWGSIRREEERVVKSERMLGDYIGPGDSPYIQYDTSVVQRTEQWLSDTASLGLHDPWCLYVGLVAPHFPLIVPREFLDFYPEGSLPPIKLAPRDGYVQHPWVAKQAACFGGDEAMRDEDERQLARRVYYALCSWLDYNIGKIVAALDANGFSQNTTLIYTSDHGDNVGARGLWGKANMYEESVSVPMLLVPPTATSKLCQTPVSLVDVSETILDHFGAKLEGDRPGRSLYDIAAEQDDVERVVFSEYHAVGAVSGCFMVRKGPWKLIHYHGFTPELFNLDSDPEETTNLAENPAFAGEFAIMYKALCDICDPAAVDAQAFADQSALVAGYGGRDAALAIGSATATPPPATAAS